MAKPKQSKMMKKLYGAEMAKIVYARCQELDENFNNRVQNYIYDNIWAKPGIPLKEKSLITVITLILANKAEQLKIHLWGLLHQGVTPDDLTNLFDYLVKQKYINSVKHVLKIFAEAKKEYLKINKFKTEFNVTLNLKKSTREKSLIDFTSHIVIGDNKKPEKCIKIIMKKSNLSVDNMKHIMQHVAIYCGFPVEMNGLAVLSKMQ